MHSFDVRKKKLFFILIAVIVILAGLVTFFVAGFGGSSAVSDGGYMVSTRISNDFDLEETPKDTIVSYLSSLFGNDATLRVEQYPESNYEIITISSKNPFDYTKESFLETVDGTYEGLLMEDWTHFHTLQPSMMQVDFTALLIAFALLLLLVFVIIWLTVGIGSSVLTVTGILVNGLLAFSVLVLLRVPADGMVIAAVAATVACGVAACISMLCRINRAVDASRKSELGTVIRGVTDGSMKNLLVYAVACAALLLAFVGLGFLFNANAVWFQYSASIAVALLISRFYSDFLIPGLYFGR